MSNNRDVGRGSRGPLLFVGTVLWLVCVCVTGTPSSASTYDQNAAESKDAMKSTLGSIGGRITVQGKPVSGFSVALQPRHQHIVDEAIATASTDAQGRYHFSKVPPGHYWIEILAREYISADGYNDDGPGRDVSLRDGAVLNDADIELIRGGVVSGRIVDSEGAAVPYEHVFLIQENKYGRREEMYLDGDDGEPFKTDAKGYYRVYGIPPGRYLIGVGVDIPRVTGEVRDRDDFGRTGSVGADHYYAETFYPGVTEKSKAHVLEVTAGSEFSDLDTVVGKRIRAFTVSGRVIDAETGEPVRNCYIELGHKTAEGMARATQLTARVTRILKAGSRKRAWFLDDST